jgi:transcriptional activator HAC1
MENLLSPLDDMPSTPSMEGPQLTISPADTSLQTPDPEDTVEDRKADEKKTSKKRKSWGQELPTPKTNLPPRFVATTPTLWKTTTDNPNRKRAKTEDEKEQRRIERVLRNRAAAQTSRERKRLEVEKLEGEKQEIEQENQFLLQRLANMEAENNRLNRQVAQLSAEIQGSRGSTPKSVVSDTASPTLTATLFKQERDDFPLEKIPFPTPMTDFSPSLKPTDLAEPSDLTQHPAAVLCDLQCQSKGSKDHLVPFTAWNLLLPMMWQLLFLTTTSAVYSTVVLPLSQILTSLKAGSPLTFSTEETYRLLPLIHWLISTPSLSPSSTASSTRRSVFRMRVLTRLLACSPALARPLRDATGKALQLAVSESSLCQTRSAAADVAWASQNWESLLTMAWAIDAIGRSPRRRLSGQKRVLAKTRRIAKLRRNQDHLYHGSIRSSRSSDRMEELSSVLMGKAFRR